MSTIGGPIRSVAIRGRIMSVAADANGTRKLGGKKNTHSPNGDGKTGRVIQEVEGWELGGLAVSIDDKLITQEFLQETIDAGEDLPIVITFCSGVDYGGTGGIDDSVEYAADKATASIKLAGFGKLIQQ
jgi:hypothetical protein